MSLPRYTDINRLSSTKMGIARYLLQIHNLYPGSMSLYYPSFDTVFNWTVDELKRLRKDDNEYFPDYSKVLVDALGLNGEPIYIYESMLRVPYHFTIDSGGVVVK